MTGSQRAVQGKYCCHCGKFISASKVKPTYVPITRAGRTVWYLVHGTCRLAFQQAQEAENV